MIMKYGSHVLLAVSKGDSLYNASVYAKKFIEEVCTKRAIIKTCNPNSILDIPRVKIEDLL